VQTSGRHLLVLINDVLDLSKIEANALAVEVMPFDFAASLRKVAATLLPLADKKGLTLSVAMDDGLGEMLGDVRRVEQIVLNLLANAIKFTESGTITLRAERLADYQTSADATPGAALRMSVTDTGIGILPEDLQQLFIPFRQIESHIARQHDGTGLGLAISARLAALMGGKIEASSHVGRGSTFTVTLPRRPPHLGDSV